MPLNANLERFARTIWNDQKTILQVNDYSPDDLDNVMNSLDLGDYLRIHYYTGLASTATSSLIAAEKQDYLRAFADLSLGCERDLSWLERIGGGTFDPAWDTSWFYVKSKAASDLTQRFYVNPLPAKVPTIAATVAEWVRGYETGADAKVIGPAEAHRDDPLVIYVADGLIDDAESLVRSLPGSDLEEHVPPATGKLGRGIATAPEMGMSWGEFCGRNVAIALWNFWTRTLELDEAKVERVHTALPTDLARYLNDFLAQVGATFEENGVDPRTLRRRSKSTAAASAPPPTSTNTAAYSEGESSGRPAARGPATVPYRVNPMKTVVDIKRGLAEGEVRRFGAPMPTVKVSDRLRDETRDQLSSMVPPPVVPEPEGKPKSSLFGFSFLKRKKKKPKDEKKSTGSDPFLTELKGRLTKDQ